jgi:hypothetical protein
MAHVTFLPLGTHDIMYTKCDYITNCGMIVQQEKKKEKKKENHDSQQGDPAALDNLVVKPFYECDHPFCEAQSLLMSICLAHNKRWNSWRLCG